MLETTREICKMCGKEYDDTHIVPRAPFAPFWCENCEDKANEVCGGWIGAVYQATKSQHQAPIESD